MIELNKAYSTSELIEALEISNRTWQGSKDEILEFLKNYFIYYSEPSQQDKRKTNYTFTAQLEEFPGYSKSAVLKEEKIKFFQNLILETVGKNNIQTAANVARIIQNRVREKYKLKPNTIAVYTSQIMRDMFKTGTHGSIVKHVWVYKIGNNIYQELSDQEVEELLLLFHPTIEEEKVKKLVDAYQNDKLTSNQFVKWMQIPKKEYLQALFDFAAGHDGHFPIKACVISTHTAKELRNETFDL